MATVEVKIPEVITFEFHQEKTDKDYGSCLWARFYLDLKTYSMTIESDCGSYGYSWPPTPERESFLKLCSRLGSDYLLEKISSRSVVDGDKTWEALKELITNEYDFDSDEDFEDKTREIEDACYSDFDERNVHDTIESALNDAFDNVGEHIEDYDIWQCIDKDFPINAKKIAEVYKEHIVPAIKSSLALYGDDFYKKLKTEGYYATN